MVFDLSVLNRVYNFARVCPKQGNIILCESGPNCKQDDKTNDYNVNLLYCNCDNRVIKLKVLSQKGYVFLFRIFCLINRVRVSITLTAQAIAK